MAKLPAITRLPLQLSTTRSRVREKLFLHRLCFDLKVAAISSNLNLQIYEVEIDEFGYDIIVDDGQSQRRFQIKTRLRPGGAKNWECHSQLFCPTPDQAAIWQFPEWTNRDAYGYNGGLILADVNWNDGEAPDVTYKYCDMAILMARRDGFSKNSTATTIAKKLCAQLQRDAFGKRRVRLPQSMLVKPKDHKALLSLMGFNVWLEVDYLTSFHMAYSRRLRGYASKSNDQLYRQKFIKVLSDRCD